MHITKIYICVDINEFYLAIPLALTYFLYAFSDYTDMYFYPYYVPVAS